LGDLGALFFLGELSPQTTPWRRDWSTLFLASDTCILCADAAGLDVTPSSKEPPEQREELSKYLEFDFNFDSATIVHPKLLLLVIELLGNCCEASYLNRTDSDIDVAANEYCACAGKFILKTTSYATLILTCIGLGRGFWLLSRPG